MIATTPHEPAPERYPGGRAFGATIRARRVGAGLTLRSCADAIGISMTALSAIEQGQRRMSEPELEAFGKATEQRP